MNEQVPALRLIGLHKSFGESVAVDHGGRPGLGGTLQAILVRFVADGGSVVFSSHVMALVEQLCDTVAMMALGVVVATGPLDEVRDGRSLQETFLGLAGADTGDAQGLSWLVS